MHPVCQRIQYNTDYSISYSTYKCNWMKERALSFVDQMYPFSEREKKHVL